MTTPRTAKLGIVTAFGNSKGKTFEPKLNDDGTLPVDIFRTGAWGHWWYGAIVSTEETLDSMIKNFDNAVVGNLVTFNYYHERNKNFGTPVRLRKEARTHGKTGKSFTMLVADVKPTDHGLEDVRRGEVLNFSSEVEFDYTHREVVEVDTLDENGKAVKDDKGNPVKTYIRTKYGPTLVGGAVTNYPFITEMNPNGIGGNREIFGDEQKYSYNDALMFSADIEHGEYAALNDISDDDIKLNMVNKGNDMMFDVNDINEMLELMDESPIMLNDCFYDKAEFKAGDAALPDAAYAIVYQIKGKSGKMSTVRKFPHHNSDAKSPDENSSLDIPRLKNAIARINQSGKTKTDAPKAKIDAAKTHLNKHADATYRKEDDKKDNSTGTGNSTVGGDEKKILFDMNDPEVKSFVENIKSGIVQQFKGELATRDAQLTEFKVTNDVLKKELDDQRVASLAIETRAFETEIVAFSDSLMDGKLPPSAKEVVRCGIRGNNGVKIKYFEKKTDGTFESKDISLKDYTSKLLSSLGAAVDMDRTSVPADSKKITDESKPDSYATKVLNDDKEFKALMKDSLGRNGGFKSKSVMSDSTDNKGGRN